MQIQHLPPLLRLIPQFAQICIIFALSKFEANSFFRPVIPTAFFLSLLGSITDDNDDGSNFAKKEISVLSNFRAYIWSLSICQT